MCQVLSQSRDKVNKTDTGPAVSLEHGRQQEASKHGVLGRSEGSHTGSHLGLKVREGLKEQLRENLGEQRPRQGKQQMERP